MGGSSQILLVFEAKKMVVIELLPVGRDGA